MDELFEEIQNVPIDKKIENKSDEKVVLSKEQEFKILSEWNNRPDNPPTLLELVKAAFDKEYDTRSKHGRAVRTFIAGKKLVPARDWEYKHKDKIELTEEQKEYISNNCSTMSVVEMARVIFKNPSLAPPSQEGRCVKEYISTLSNKVLYATGQEIPDEDYKPPNTPDRVVARINRYVHNELDLKKLGPIGKKNIQSLMGYLHTYRFISHINNYENQPDRELFESEFVRCCHDKNDLTEEEVDQYIIYSAEVVISKNIARRIETFSKKLDDDLEDEDKKLTMTLVDAITSLRNEYNQCVKRQRDLLQDLQGTRSKRLENRVKENASILNLVELWKHQETREQILKLAELRKTKLKEEVEGLANMEEIKARVLGISIEEVLNN